MGKASRRKGQVAERALAKWLRGRGYAEARRGLPQSSGAIECDVEGLPWWVEVKAGVSVEGRVLGACRQAARDTDGRACLVVWRGQERIGARYGPWMCAEAVGTSDKPTTRGVATIARDGYGAFHAAGRRWLVTRLECVATGPTP